MTYVKAAGLCPGTGIALDPSAPLGDNGGMSARYWRPEGLGGVELLRADASIHRYARHSHEGYAIGVVAAGAHVFSARGEVWRGIPGRVVCVNPDDAHDGGPSGRDGAYSYRMLYVDGGVFATALAEAVGRPAGLPFFPEPVVEDEALAERLMHLHRTLEEPATRLERESLLVTALAALGRRHGRTAADPAPGEGEPPGVARALEHLTAHFAEDLSLAEIAGVAGLDRFRLLRAFRRRLGLPPHLYQTQLRLRHARRLMLAGEPPAMAAVAAGFADQSHLIRKFKAAYGVTPGRWLKVQ
jgi:AraC-like DNA-binding protein